MSVCTRILLVDDHALLRDSVAFRLQQEEDFQVVGVAGSAADAVAMVAECRPDIILMDIDMPGLSCFEAVGEIRILWPTARVVFLSAFFHDGYIEEVLRVEGRGYLTKNDSPDTLICAIRAVRSGEVYFSPDVRSRLVVDDQGVQLAASSRTRMGTLSRREMDILRYVAKGLAKKQIAAMTRVSVKTVESHVQHLMNKLDLHDRVALTRFAIREGIAEP